MGSIAEDSHAVLLLADYISADAASKINLMGAGFSIAGWTGAATAPMHVAVMIDVHGRHAGQTLSYTVELRDTDLDQVVQLPGPTGKPEALQFGQVATVQPPAIPGVALPRDLPCRIQMLLAFPTGLPLTTGRRYKWRLLIDNTHRKSWVANFYVPEPPSPPVYGGPSGPGDIPGVESIPDEDDPLEKG